MYSISDKKKNMSEHQRKFKNSGHKSGMNKRKKGRFHKPKQSYEIDITADDRFSDFTKPLKEPPVDMYGRLRTPDALDNYISSSDDEPDLLIPEDARPAESEDDGDFSDKIYRRLALTNQPWSNVTAQDIFQYINIAMTENETYDDLISVKVYLSRFGQEHPELEAPPPSEIEEVETARWRKREADNLKRYFAICEFKDAEAANRVYDKLRNVGLNETDSISFDLAFVNDETQFDSFPLRDEANSLMKDWTPPEIYSPFLTKTKNNDTWDSAPKERVNAIKAIWDAGENDNVESLISQLLASSGNSEDETRPGKEDLADLLEQSRLAEEEDDVDDADQVEDFQVQFVQKKEEIRQEEERRMHSRKPKKGKKEETKQVVDETQLVQEIVQDDRFADLFAKPGYGIDSSDPNFKRTPLMEKFMDVVSKKHMEVNAGSHLSKEKNSAVSQMESTVDRIRKRAAEQAKKNKH